MVIISASRCLLAFVPPLHPDAPEGLQPALMGAGCPKLSRVQVEAHFFVGSWHQTQPGFWAQQRQELGLLGSWT